MEGWLAEAWGQARSMESKPEWKTAELMGWTEKGGRIDKAAYPVSHA